MAADVIVVGGGLVGLCAALALAERRLQVEIIAQHRTGEASPAAAGMLAPSVEQATGAAHDFAIAARDRYPVYLDYLAERSGMRVPLNRLGILQVAISERGIKGLKKTAPPTSEWIDAARLRELEPALSHAGGAMLNPNDGSVDNVLLLDALEKALTNNPFVKRLHDAATRLRVSAGATCVVYTATGETRECTHVIAAAGAWIGQIDGLRLAHVVTPSRGQLVAYQSTPLRHVAYGPRGYIVPRGDVTIGGSTMENVGFDSATTEEGLRKVSSAAEDICPPLRGHIGRSWAGLRPVTPDMLPLIGPDPENPAVIYACGHSRNGVLMAPLTGDIIADLVTGTPLSHDLAQFRPDRF